MKKIFNYLASANSGYGFINNFKYINPQENAYDFILKGGSGTGKSTLMRKIAQYYLEKGEDIEYFYCSSDINSLDGVRIISKNISILDGTAPHTTEATIPKINSEIVNLGEFIKDSVRDYSLKIKDIIARKGKLYQLFYKYIEVCKIIDEIVDSYNISESIDINYYVSEIFNKIHLKKKNEKSINRKLFNSAIAIDGIKKFDNKMKNEISISLNTFYASKVLNELAEKISNYGYEVISICNVINPNKYDEIIIPQIKTKIINKNSSQNSIVIALENKKNYFILKAGKIMRSIRSLHKSLEKYYVSSLDINGLDETYFKLISKINNLRN